MRMDKKITTRNLILTSFFIAIGLVIPRIFHMFALGGQIFLPMHIPVLLCGFICGGPLGAVCGALTLLLNSLLTGMPPIYPVGIAMMVELIVYGFVSGILFKVTKRKIFLTLICAMLAGRIALGVTNMIVFGFANKPYSFEAFLTASFITSLPGIIIQLIIIPGIIYLLKRGGFIVGGYRSSGIF